MSDPLSARIDDLEARLAYQDQAIEDLNATITEQWKQIETLTRHLAELRDRMSEALADPGPQAPEPPPPHY